MSSPLEVAPARFADADTQVLVDQVQAEYVRLYGSPDESPLVEGEFDPPRGAFLVGRVDGVPVAMGGWRRRADVAVAGRGVVVEVKRMYVVPAARRRGYAAVLLAHLEATAAEAGAEAVVLETGTAQPAAIAMYLAAGYRPLPGFGHYADSPLSRSFLKPL